MVVFNAVKVNAAVSFSATPAPPAWAVSETTNC